MSLAITHFAVGGSLTAICVTFLVPDVRFPRTAMVGGGAWAMVPDAWRIVPVGSETILALHETFWADVFWFHRTLDALDSADSELLAAATLVAFTIVTYLVEQRDYRSSTGVR